jgi:hypothetical protein
MKKDCPGCDKGKHPTVIMPCNVCELVDNDTTAKRVKYCDLCKAYICADHWKDAPARIEAATKTIVQKVKKRFKKRENETTA